MRIVSLAPSNTEILYALDIADQIVAVTDHCDYPPAAKKKPKVGGWARVDDELVRKFKPDLILTSTVVQYNAPKRYSLQGLNVLHLDPRTLDEVFTSWITIGKTVGKEKQAKKLVTKAKFEIGNWKLEIGNYSYRPRLYCEEWHHPPMVSGNWVRDLAIVSHATYSLVKKGSLSCSVSTEEMRAYDPEIIVINICGAGTRVNKSIVMKRPGWEKLTAVRTGEVWVVDDSLLNRPSPRLVLGLRLISDLVTRYLKKARSPHSLFHPLPH